MEEKEAIKNLKEIIDLSKEEIENNDENTTAILDITDLKSLAIILNLLEQTQTKKSLKGIINKQNKEIQELKADRVEKDKIIDLMAEEINDEIEKFWDNDVIETIKFFQKKASEENEEK